jgi:hypothetical protein
MILQCTSLMQKSKPKEKIAPYACWTKSMQILLQDNLILFFISTSKLCVAQDMGVNHAE